MGMTRAVGFGFLLLLVVTHSTEQSGGTTEQSVTEAERKQAVLNGLSSSEHYLGEHVTEKTITDAKVGDKFYFLMDNKPAAESSGLATNRCFPNRSVSSSHLRIGDVKEVFTSVDEHVSSLFRVEVVPMKSGSHTFKMSRTDGTFKTVMFSSVSQGHVFFLTPYVPFFDLPKKTIRIPRDATLTFFAENWPNKYSWKVRDPFDVETTPIVDASEFEDAAYHAPLKTFRATLADELLGLNDLDITLMKGSDRIMFNYEFRILPKN